MRKPVSVSKKFHSTNGQFPKPGQNRNRFRHNQNALNVKTSVRSNWFTHQIQPMKTEYRFAPDCLIDLLYLAMEDGMCFETRILITLPF